MKVRIQSSKDKLWAIFEIIGAVLCLFNITQLWWCLILLVGCAALNVHLYKKHKKAEEQVSEFLNKGLDLNKNKDGTPKVSRKDEQKLRKQNYENRLKEIEEEFSDEIFEGLEEDDDYEEDEDE